jgi:hypothetical protein
VLDLIVESDDRRERRALRREFVAMYNSELRAKGHSAIDAVVLIDKIARRHGAAQARAAAASDKYPGDIRKRAVQDVDRLRKVNPRMSVYAAAKKIGSTLGIPPRTLTRWVSGR